MSDFKIQVGRKAPNPTSDPTVNAWSTAKYRGRDKYSCILHGELMSCFRLRIKQQNATNVTSMSEEGISESST